jgi:hypothetical protein
MMKTHFNLVIFLMLSVPFQSCGILKKFWGEAPPAPKVVTVEGKSLPPIREVFSADEVASLAAWEAWKAELRGLFQQIRGQQDGLISVAEISTLARKGFVKISDDPETTQKQVASALRLFGFKDGITPKTVENLIHWFESHRVQARSFYRMAFAADASWEGLQSRDLVHLVELFGSFVSLGGGGSITAAEMNELILPWIPEQYVHARAALESGLDLSIAFFASFCGDRVEVSKWNGRKVGTCLTDLLAHFESSAELIDFILGNIDPIRHSSRLRQAAEEFTPAVESWLTGHYHPLFPTGKVAKFAQTLEIPEPYAFFKLTEWIPKLNEQSNVRALSPTFFIDLARVASGWTKRVLDITQSQKPCEASDWKTCPFEGEYETAQKLYNAEYATLIRSKTLGFVSKIALYESVSQFLMSRFDPTKTGLASEGIKDLITVGIRLIDTNAFAYNVINRILERPFTPSNAEASTQNVSRQGLSELAALAADLIPGRGKDRRGLLKKLQSQVHDPANELSYAMDELGITAFLYIFDLITHLRHEYIKNLKYELIEEGPKTYVKRKDIVASFPKLLHDYFPRIYNECVEWGFERTCGVVMTEVLPSPLPGRDDLETYEIDLVTLTAVLLESMMNRCDRNGSDTIGSRRWFTLDGYTEKSCVIHVSASLTLRLMKANLVENNEQTKLLLNLMRRVAPVRWAAKVALARGSLKGTGMIFRALPPLSLFSSAASLGSIMSLAAEFMDPEKVKAIDTGTLGPHRDAGDELIYFEQLSRHHMQGLGTAERTQSH